MRGGATPVVNKEVKESREMSFAPKDTNPAWQRCAVHAIGKFLLSCFAFHSTALIIDRPKS